MHVALLYKVSEEQPLICSEEVQQLYCRLSTLPMQQGEHLFSWLLTCTSWKDRTVYTDLYAQLWDIYQTTGPSAPAFLLPQWAINGCLRKSKNKANNDSSIFPLFSTQTCCAGCHSFAFCSTQYISLLLKPYARFWSNFVHKTQYTELVNYMDGPSNSASRWKAWYTT